MRLDHPVKNLDVTSYILLLLLAVQLAFFIWGLNRGFDFTDEAYSYLGFTNPEEINKVATYYVVFINKLFGGVGISIVKIRIIRLILLISCGLVLAFGLSNWLRKNAKLSETQHLNLVLFILLGSLLINAYGSQSFTYNLSTTFLLQLIVGCILHLDQRGYKISIRDEALFFVIGALLFMLFAIKFSSAIFLVATIWVLIFLTRRDIYGLASHTASMLIGAVFMGIFFFGGSLLTWIIDYKNTLVFLASTSIGSIGNRYVEDLHYTLSSKIIANVFTVVATLGLFVINYMANARWVKALSLLMIGVFLVRVTFQGDYYLGGPKHYYIFTGLYILLIVILLLSQVVVFTISRVRHQPVNVNLYRFIILLLLIPLYGSIGTGNLLSIQVIWYTSFIFAALYLLLLAYEKSVLNVMIILLSLNGGIQAVSGLVYFPYRINKTLYEESVSLSGTIPGESIRVNMALKESIRQTNELIYSRTRYSKGGPIFSFSPDYYGFIYLLNGVLPGWGWYDEKGTPVNCYSLNNSRSGNLEDMIMLLPAYYSIDSTYQECFSKLGINFPEDYANLGNVPYFMGDLDRSFSVYAPRHSIKGE